MTSAIGFTAMKNPLLSAALRVFAGLLSVGCDSPNVHSNFRLPTRPTEVAAVPAPAPYTSVDATPIELGEVVQRTIVSTPPMCLEFAGWPCQYFELTPSKSGTLEVIAIYATATQNGQPIDITLESPRGQTWAQTFLPGSPLSEGRLTATVIAGERYRITLWYTFLNLEYELRTVMR